MLKQLLLKWLGMNNDTLINDNKLEEIMIIGPKASIYLSQRLWNDVYKYYFLF